MNILLDPHPRPAELPGPGIPQVLRSGRSAAGHHWVRPAAARQPFARGDGDPAPAS